MTDEPTLASLDSIVAKAATLPEPMKALLRKALGDPPTPEAWCNHDAPSTGPGDRCECGEIIPARPRRFAVTVFTYQKAERGYIPSVVYENESGHYPLIGSGEFAEPWYFGHDFETAERMCAEMNAERGITPDDARQIIDSSILASIREQAAHDAAAERMQRLIIEP